MNTIVGTDSFGSAPQIATRDAKLETLLAELQKADRAFDYNVPQAVRDTFSNDDLLAHLDRTYRQPFFPITQPEAVAKYADIGVRVRAKSAFYISIPLSPHNVELLSVDGEKKTASVKTTGGWVFSDIPFNELYAGEHKHGKMLTRDEDLDLRENTLLSKFERRSLKDGDKELLFPGIEVPAGRYYRLHKGDTVFANAGKIRGMTVAKDALGLISRVDQSTYPNILWDDSPLLSFYTEYRGAGWKSKFNPCCVEVKFLSLELRNTVPYEKLLQSTGVRVLG